MKLVIFITLLCLTISIWTYMYFRIKQDKQQKNKKDYFTTFMIGACCFTASMSALASMFPDPHGFNSGILAVLTILLFIFGVAAPFTYDASSGINKD
jgi:hypothetical protein